MEDHYYRLLAQRYLDGKLTDNELEVFIHLLNEGKMEFYLKEAIDTETGITEQDEISIKKNNPIRYLNNSWVKYAAAIIVLLGVVAMLYLNRAPHKQQMAVSALKHDALPGGNKAVLILANGDSISLDEASNGQIARQGNAKVNKVQNGLITYASGKDTSTKITWNTINTPKGGQYNVKLADGSMVWLNSASSITFPTLFNGDTREVKITGEAYFEVAKNAAKPFLVQCGGQTVRVLGTHFNINAYDDEPGIRTTLLEGSIRINTGSQSKLLVPGQQAIVNGDAIAMETKRNLAAVTAWKDGLFVFDDTNLPQLMRQIARWYDVKIIYNGKPGDYAFVGEINRNTRLTSVLKILEVSGVRFKIENKQLIIQP